MPAPIQQLFTTAQGYLTAAIVPLAILSMLATVGMILVSFMFPFWAARHGGKIAGILLVVLGTPIGIALLPVLWAAGGGR